MKRFLPLLLLVPLLLAACGDDGSGADADSGVRGVVLLGPQCPVVQEASPCPDEPMPGVEVRALRDGSVVGSDRTDAVGRFEIALAPGTYVLQAIVGTDGPPPTARPVNAIVVEGSFTDVTVPVDSGIR